MLKQKSIRLFIDIMWKEYRSVLIRNVLVPFTLFVAVFVILVSHTAWIDPTKPFNKASDSDKTKQVVVMASFTCIALIAWLIFLEMKALVIDWKRYLTDSENAMDLAYIVTSVTYIW